MLNVNDVNQIYLGCQGENLARTIVIDVKPWLVEHPSGNIAIWHKRNGASEATATGATFDPEAGTVTWQPTSTDTYAFGEGEAEIRLSEGNVVKKSRTVKTDVAKAVTGSGVALGSGWQDYLDAIQRAAGVSIIKDGMIKLAINSAGHLIFSYTDEVPVVPDDDATESTYGDLTFTDLDLGPADAYAIAVAGGYTGTKEQFETDMGNSATNATTASNKAEAANADALKSEGFAVGKQNSEDVDSSSPYYHNNAKYYRDSAAAIAAGDVIDDDAGAGDTSLTWSADKLSSLKSAIDELQETVNTPVANTKDMDTSITYTGRSNSCIIIYDSVSADTNITSIKADIVKSTGATYKFKLVEYLQTSGKGIYTATKLSDELTFEEPSGEHGIKTVELQMPFVISAGHGLAVVSKESGLFGYNTGSGTYDENVDFLLRNVTYDTLAVDTKLMNQTAVPTATTRRISFAVYNEVSVIKDFITEDEAETMVDGKIDDEKTIINYKYETKAFGYIADKYIYNGQVTDDPNHRWVTLDRYVWLNKGDTVICGRTERIKLVRYYNDFQSYEDTASSVSYYTITTSGYYRWAVDIQRSISGITEPYEDTTNSIVGQVNEYGQEVNDAYNAVAIMQNPFVMSDNTQLMAHCAMMDYDSSDKTIWLVYYANESTTNENNTDVRTYLTIKHIDPYAKSVIASTTFKVGDSIGGYTQANTPPYDPTITVLSDYVLVTFWGNENNERCISCFRVDKSTLALSNYAVNKLTYNGTDYDLNCTNLKAIYEAYSGTTISTIDTVAFSCHFPVYNNEYYGVINDIFSASGYKSFLVKSSDLITWSIVHCFTEIPATNEASICIRNGILYMSDRNNMYVTSYNLSNGTVKYVSIPMVQGCKSCVFNYKNTLGEEKVVLASNIIAKYTESVEGFRRNMGLFVINEDLSIELKSRILTSAGCHYPDLASDGFDLFLLWSEDRRNLNRKVQRSDIGFARVLI